MVKMPERSFSFLQFYNLLDREAVQVSGDVIHTIYPHMYIKVCGFSLITFVDIILLLNCRFLIYNYYRQIHRQTEKIQKSAAVPGHLAGSHSVEGIAPTIGMLLLCCTLSVFQRNFTICICFYV